MKFGSIIQSSENVTKSAGSNTYSNSNLVKCPSNQLGAYDSHPQASGSPPFFTTFLDRIGSSIKFVAFLAQTCVFSSLRVFDQVQVRRPFRKFNCCLICHSFNTFDVCLGSLFCWNTRLHKTAIFWLMILGFHEEFGDNPPSSLLYILSLEQQIHGQQNSPTA